ncbi:STAS domain-containing protein [Streptomyces rubellomurinus]|uniref:STAS domain-containing protein n=1 Tax=Streptomyces rubellomurinus (strain ATCC 31215) TaxID=359131 RepID=UPI0005F10317|nr:STAS domain-containing protein [Streptomyces rubellomurinus]
MSDQPDRHDTAGQADVRLRVTARERAVRALVCRLAGEADHETRAALDEALAEAVAAGPDLLVVDLAPLTFCDSSCLNALLRAREDAEAAGVWLVLAGPGPQIRRLLAITGTDQVFTVRASLQAAVGVSRLPHG